MKRLKIILTVFLCTLLCICLCSCETWNNFRKAFIDPPQPEVHKIKIGVFEPLTGRQSYDAEDEIAGIELAHSLYPSVLGYDVELIYEDNRSNTDVCVTAAQSLINQGCAVVLGSVSDTLSLAASDVFKNASCPAISATNTVPILTQTNPYYFRTSYINSFDAEGAAEYTTKVLNEIRCAVFLQKNNDYEQGKCEQFEKDVNEYAGTATFEIDIPVYNEETEEYDIVHTVRPLVKYVYITGQETDAQINNILTSLHGEGYYTIYCPSSPEIALPFIKASRSFDFPVNDLPQNGEEDPQQENPFEPTENDPQNNEEEKVPEFNWIGTELWLNIEQKAAEQYGQNDFLKDVVYTIDYDPAAKQSEIAKAFLDAYHTQFGADATPSDNVALGFDAYILALQAIKDCDLSDSGENSNDTLLFDEKGVFNRERLKNKLYNIVDLEAVTGTISINENGDPVKDIFIRQFDGNTFNVVYSVRPVFVNNRANSNI